MANTNSNASYELGASATISIHNGKEVVISVDEYTRLKDIETRFTIIKEQMLRAEYCPIHTQIILGIENEYKQMPDFLTKKFNIPKQEDK